MQGECVEAIDNTALSCKVCGNVIVLEHIHSSQRAAFHLPDVVAAVIGVTGEDLCLGVDTLIEAADTESRGIDTRDILTVHHLEEG